jgi:hypothetical protein
MIVPASSIRIGRHDHLAPTSRSVKISTATGHRRTVPPPRVGTGLRGDCTSISGGTPGGRDRMKIDGTHRIAHARRLVTAAVCAGALAVVCGGAAMATTVPPGDSAPADTATAAPVDSSPAAEPAAVAVTLTETSIDGLPDDLVAGLVDVTVTDETEGADGEINFVRVEPGTDFETLKTDLIESIFTGGPIPDYWLNLAGVRGHAMITLDEGEYIVLIDLAATLNRPSTVNDLVTAPLTVGPGDNDAVIPATNGGRILAGDYLFDADLTGGGSTVTFTNSSDNQFHHVIVWDFGTNDPAAVEEHLPGIVESDGAGPPPEGIDMDQVTPFIASSGVHGPGSSGTFDFAFEEGHTYAVMCFIQDRNGGLPHVLQHGMYDVFQFGAANTS